MACSMRAQESAHFSRLARTQLETHAEDPDVPVNNPGSPDIDPGNSACDGVNSRTPDAWDPAHGASGNLGSDAIGHGD